LGSSKAITSKTVVFHDELYTSEVLRVTDLFITPMLLNDGAFQKEFIAQ